MISRRSFLKFLAVALPATTIAPAAVAKLAALTVKKIQSAIAEAESMAEIPAITGEPQYVFVTEWATMDELQARFQTDVDKNPLLRGELGIYDGLTFHPTE